MPLDTEAKKTALRMIPYGIYVLTAEAPDGRVAAATVNWVTQASFEPPLVALGVKVGSGVHEIIKETRRFALSILGKDQADPAFAFFKPTVREGNNLNGQPVHAGENGAPLLDDAPAYLEFDLVTTVEQGDHSLFVGQVTAAMVKIAPTGRADDVTLLLKDLGEKIFYGG
jgi:flavin reductase (DIM6/NTAB) family NADH-FMN oxidoreductase RutF